MVNSLVLPAAGIVVVRGAAMVSTFLKTNRGGGIGIGLPSLGGGGGGAAGLARAALAALGIDSVLDALGFPSLLGGNDNDTIEDMIFEMVDSGAIRYDPTDRQGAEHPMEYVVVPVGANNSNEVTYGLSYRPFSKSTLNTIQKERTTVRRTRRPQRRRS